MVKKPMSLYLDMELVEELRARNYNISYLCNESMKVYLTHDFSDIEISVKLSAMDTIINDLYSVVVKKQLEYEQAIANHQEALGRRAQIEQDYNEAQATLRVSRMIQELNKSIIALDFDISQIQITCETLITRIKDITPYFDLDMHVTRLKNVLS